MNEADLKAQAHGRRAAFSLYTITTVGVSVAAITATIALSNLELGIEQRTKGYSAVIAVYVCICVLLYFRQARQDQGRHDDPRDDALEQSLTAIDEAIGYFTGSLRTSDAFRLVAGRVNDVVPYNTISLYLLNDERSKIVAVHADGAMAESERGRELDIDAGLPGRAFVTGEVEADSDLKLDNGQTLGSAVAIPLKNGDSVFGVIQLLFDRGYDPLAANPSPFEALGTRISPLMLGAISFERTQANALTDITTDLPNERAFYLVLENQVAEAQRKRGERPLTVLAIDIKGFDEINRTFGHVAGDRVLNFAAQVIKENLRQMDFVARALNDEFLVILPTADKEVSHEIISRIQKAFFRRELAINDKQRLEIELNIGWAAFGEDGERPGQLLSLAQLRKEQIKTSGSRNVLWFPRESSYPAN